MIDFVFEDYDIIALGCAKSRSIARNFPEQPLPEGYCEHGSLRDRWSSMQSGDDLFDMDVMFDRHPGVSPSDYNKLSCICGKNDCNDLTFAKTWINYFQKSKIPE